MTNDLLFIIAIIVFILYEYFNRNKTTENFAETTAVTSEQVKQMIRDIYLADIDAIRNLSNVATKLSTGGYTAPGNFTVSGTTNSSAINSGQIIVKGKDGNSVVLNPNATDQDKLLVYAGSNGKPPYLFYNKDGTIGTWNGTEAPWSINSNGEISGKIGINVNNNTNEGGRISIKNSLKDGAADKTNNWTLWNMTGGYGNKLSFWRYNGDGSNKGPAMDLFDNSDISMYGNLNVQKNLTIGSTQITEDILKRVINQQQYAGFAVDGEGSTMPLYEGDWNLYGGAQFDAWTSDKWDIIYINRGWRITCWHHEIGNSQAAKDENRTSNVPKRMTIPGNTITSYRAEWIGY